MGGPSRLAVVTALVSVGAFALAGVLFVADSGAATERLGLLFALFGTIVAGLLGALRADAAATSTSASSTIATALNGNFDTRVRNAMRTVGTESPRTPQEPLPHPDTSTPPA